MIKILDQNELYGFDFEAKIGENRTTVIMSHEDKYSLKKARNTLKDFYDYADFVFLTKVIKKKSDNTMWVILAIALIFFLIIILFWFFYEKDLIFSSSTNSISIALSEVNQSSKPVIEEIEIDIEKLKAFKDSFSEKNTTTLDAGTMKALNITTSIISSLVSEKEKAKYSSKKLVESFKGKSGIRFVAKDGNLSKDFNATIKDLNAYAQGFIKDNNVSLALQCFDKALDVNISKENKDEVLLTLANQGEVYENIGQIEKAKKSYSQILELTKEDSIKYGLTNALIHSKLSDIYKDLNQTEIVKEELIKSETLYKNLLIEFRKKSKNGKINKSQLAWGLNHLANFYENYKKEYIVSIQMRKEAISLYKDLSKKNPKKFAILYYKTLNSLGNTYLLLNKIDLARKTYIDALNIAKKVLKKSSFKALSFRALARVEIKNKKFIKAEKYYNDALKIYKKLQKKHSKLYSDKLIEMYSCFAFLEKEKGNYKLAEKRYKKVILSYKKMNRENPLKYNLKIAKALNDLASMQILYLKNPIDAEIKLFESLSLAKKVKEIEQKKAKEVLAQTYRSLAYLAILEKNMRSAWDYYQKVNSLKKFT